MAPRIWEWIDSHDDEQNPLIPAATVILLRDASAGLETLMLRRNSKLSFAELVQLARKSLSRMAVAFQLL